MMKSRVAISGSADRSHHLSLMRSERCFHAHLVMMGAQASLDSCGCSPVKPLRGSSASLRPLRGERLRSSAWGALAGQQGEVRLAAATPPFTETSHALEGTAEERLEGIQ